eukprot:4374556-Amphidinium_carterae.1
MAEMTLDAHGQTSLAGERKSKHSEDGNGFNTPEEHTQNYSWKQAGLLLLPRRRRFRLLPRSQAGTPAERLPTLLYPVLTRPEMQKSYQKALVLPETTEQCWKNEKFCFPRVIVVGSRSVKDALDLVGRAKQQRADLQQQEIATIILPEMGQMAIGGMISPSCIHVYMQFVQRTE